jgi:hypothetical protein
MDWNFLKWLLEVDIRAKNATSLLAAFVAVSVAYFAFRSGEWFQAMTPWGQVASLVLVLVASFLAVWLVWSLGAALRDARSRRLVVRSTLGGLTDRQRQVLLRYVVENRTQIPEWEIGPFRAVWDAELDALMRKGVVTMHPGGMCEIAPAYLDDLRANWNPANGTLS